MWMRRWSALAAAALLGAVLPALLPAEDSRPEDRLGEVKRKIRSEESRGEKIRTSKSGVLDSLETLDTQIERTREDLRRSRRQSQELAVQIQHLQEELKSLDEQVRLRRMEAGRRLDAYYRLGRDGLLPVVFSSTSLPRKMRDLDALRRVLDTDWTEIRAFHRLVVEKETMEQAVQGRLAEEKALGERIRSQERELVASRTEQQALRARLEKDEKLHKQLLEELVESARQLEALLRRAAEAPLPATAPPDGAAGMGRGLSFASRKGQLPWPVKGEILRKFGTHHESSVKARVRSRGIDIRTVPDEPVRAVWGGSVVHAEWFRGYGNLIIVDHGQKHFTVLSHLGRMTKGKGDPVEAGEILGYAQDSGSLEGCMVHFAVWRQGKPEDPLHWIRKEAPR